MRTTTYPDIGAEFLRIRKKVIIENKLVILGLVYISLKFEIFSRLMDNIRP